MQTPSAIGGRTSDHDRPVWRSLLFVPVNVEKYVAKAHTYGADAILLDLEDSIPRQQKAHARTLVTAAAKLVGRSGADVLVRINQPLREAVPDLECVVSSNIDGLVLPKVDSASHLRLIAQAVDDLEVERGVSTGQIRLIALVETADAFYRLREIASAHPRLAAIGLGSEDLATDIQAFPDPDVMLHPKQSLIMAARAAGIIPLGLIGTVANYSDLESVRTVVTNSRRFGMDGAFCIHPSVVPLLNRGFRPSEDDISAARRTVDAFNAALSEGRASLVLDGKMIDYPVAERAARVLARAELIRAREARGARC